MVSMKKCPIDTAMKYIGKKWSINIIRDMFEGKKRFKDFLKSNPNLSTKVLSERLRDLEAYGLIKKSVVSMNPVLIEYELTKKGKGLKGILYELALFAFSECSSEICTSKIPKKKAIAMIKQKFR